MGKLILIRGLPGSGKSTLAKRQSGIHLEADMFFMKQGQYCYDGALIQKAHRWCERKTAKLLQQGRSVVVSNTFVEWWQIEPYIEIAKQQNVRVKIIEARGHYQNLHQVPEEAILKMKLAYQDNAAILSKIREMLPAAQLCMPQSEARF